MLRNKRYGRVNYVFSGHERSCNSREERIKDNVRYAKHQYKSENIDNNLDPGIGSAKFAF